MALQLFNYFRSSASYRVRIALALKGLDYDYMPVQLTRNEHFKESYAALSPARLVPLLKDDERIVTQSLAIIEYLDELHPQPLLLPGTALERARIRALALDVACEIHPLNNLRVLRYLTQDMGLSSQQKDAWYAHWIALGLGALEEMLATSSATGQFCHGDTPTLADCCLVPQVFNARRFGCPTQGYPTIERIVATCEQLPAFAQAAPGQQPDAE